MRGISLVVPCHNHAATLPRALASALQQSGLLEVIVVNDRSTDDTLDVLGDWVRSDKRIRAVHLETNVGPGAARNVGVAVAQGSYVSFLDADDEFLGDFFGKALEIFESNSGIRTVKPDEEFFDPIKGGILPPYDPRHQAAVLSSVHGLILDREVFLRIGGFPEDRAFRGTFGGEDVAFMQALIEHCQPIARIGMPCYRVWSQSGAHVDRFLANTRLRGDSFEFVQLHSDQEPNGLVATALSEYLTEVRRRLTSTG